MTWREDVRCGTWVEAAATALVAGLGAWVLLWAVSIARCAL